ncbi:MAG: methionyl-tRNA formyltransferase [Zetaproteobacteria bacterium CG12_big_fil_rev_8_21_14_0_65_55_1124]|nr:MAG: methionyl-tRNA formyltransferase [Zetaproteobacteria bacterium CG1_02_55_237]PIS18348.1 MAG: methionyl-tRNA formyltransferase [Zetaproteobacteria bacterium CG08_land_8_20_14_0_20_55_17]PIW43111.1 MAG: methionyl-tRNA formyltransferase [Zetaproteobacteria bacterium CG12_big_fil_rev_8_21_14_0_65_55_1124]PIY52288.1 MAG: methionyl-tRNA formyltransferase [Zetaproteobacteria bacterium CG_4_10_14_0_8_um_filter_55_43]PIZ38779.1 MAG: methionyl-tRNA formyltransferase [Zetaproteobacteria bacterium 
MRVVFAGTPAFSVPCLEALLNAADVEVVGVVSQPDRPAGRGMRLTPSPVKQAALDAGFDVITPERLRGDAAALNWLKERQPDVLVVVAFGMILPVEWLETPRIAPLNVHASLLPRWRGAAPIERALLAGDAETGVCIMHMEQGLDTGGVYAVRHLPITFSTTGASLWTELSQMGASLLIDSLPGIANGTLQAASQDETQTTYAAKLSNEERIIDWTAGATHVDRQVRCFSPRPGARTLLDGKWLKVLRGEICRGHTQLAPGCVASSDLSIACGNGTMYRLLEVQPEGKTAMPAADFLRGRPLAKGDALSG